MNISKLIAKFILASFVFSSMQGLILAIGGETGSKKTVNIRNQEIDRIIKNDPVIPFPVKNSGTEGKNSGTPGQNPTTEVPAEVKKEAQTMFASLLARLPELPSKADLYAKLPSKGDVYAQLPSKDGLYNGFKETKDGVLNIVTKVTPESILKTKYGIEAVTFVVVAGTAYAIYYVGVKKGGFKKIQTTLGSVANFVKSSPKTLAASAAAGLAALAYKTDAKTAAYVLGGAVALYGLKKLAGYTKNGIISAATYASTTIPGQVIVSGASSTKKLAVSGKNAVVSGAKSVASKVGNLVPAPIKSAASTVASVGSKLVSGAKSVVSGAASYLFGKKSVEQLSVAKIIADVTQHKDSDQWLKIHSARRIACNLVWKGRVLLEVAKLQGYDKDALTKLVNAFYTSQPDNRQASAQAIIDFLGK